MWIFSNHSFMSIVESENSPHYFLIQSRFPGHIERLFPNAHVDRMEYGIYRFRATVPKQVVAQRVVELLEEVDYLNFKDSIADSHYHTACQEISATLDRYSPPPKYVDELDEQMS
jgi:hypothetical protein